MEKIGKDVSVVVCKDTLEVPGNLVLVVNL